MNKKYLTQLASEKEKLAFKTEKVELGAIDDLDNKYKKIAAKAPKIKQQILKLANSLGEVSNELDDLQDDFKKLEGMAKELGADNIEKRAKQMFMVVGNLSGAWGKVAISIESEAKKI